MTAIAWNERAVAQNNRFPFIEVFEVGISSDLKGLHSLVRVATFNRDKNHVSWIWAGFRW